MTKNCKDQLQLLFGQLKEDKLRAETIENIGNLINDNTADVVDIIKDYGLRKLFRLISIKENVQLDILCPILKLCFNMYKPGEVVIKFIGQFMYLLRHYEVLLRDMAIDQVYKGVVLNPLIYDSNLYDDIFVAIAQMITDSKSSVRKNAIILTSNLPARLYPKVLTGMEVLLQYDTSAKGYLFEVIINVSKKSEELMILCEQNCGYIKFMLSELDCNDALYELNILELLSRLAKTPHGISMLIELGCLDKISQLMSELGDKPLRNFLEPGYMRFFGSVAYVYPREILEKYPLFFDSIYKAIDESSIILPVALDTLGLIGTTVEGKLSLAALGSKYTSTVEKVGQKISCTQTEDKKNAISCMANLIGHNKDTKLITKNVPVDHRVVLMTREWFRSISSKPPAIEVLHKNCMNPFRDIHPFAYELLDAVCQYSWGQELVAKSPGFVEYLLDRNTSTEKSIKEVKYEIIQRLSRSSAFDPTMILRLQQYVKEGPFYKEVQVDVAMEEDGGE